MARRAAQVERAKEKTLYAAAELFLEQGYANTTLRGLAQKAEADISAINRAFGCKENILCELVTYVHEMQFSTAAAQLAGVTDAPILFYAAETTTQLLMAESRESVRELYLTAYFLPQTMDVIQQMITQKLERIFKAHLTTLTTKDFYELEIATGGIVAASWRGRATCILQWTARCAGFWKRRSGCFRRRTRRFRRRAPLCSSSRLRTSRRTSLRK